MGRKSAADKVRSKGFPVVLRGYDRAAVESWKDEVAQLVERLEEQAPRDAAVKRALDEVGAETAAILQRAHEAAEEITARSRSRADGRLERAEREAEEASREAEQRVEQLEADTRRVWEERARLLEEMRQLADEVLGVADDALDRLDQPQEQAAPEQPAPEQPAPEQAAPEQPTMEVEAIQLEPSELDGATAEAPAIDREPAESRQAGGA